jgi:hypothetical protein
MYLNIALIVENINDFLIHNIKIEEEKTDLLYFYYIFNISYL